MTITGTSTHHQLMVAWARHDIEHHTGPNPSREKAGRVLREWRLWEAMTTAEVEAVLAAYQPAHPEPEVADPDPWCEIVADSKLIVDAMLAEDLRAKVSADAALIVAEVQDETDWSAFGPCELCHAAAGQPCVFVLGHRREGEKRRYNHAVRALVEVTDEPTPAPEVFDDSVPPGGFVCSVCRTPVESEPCPEHGEKVTDEPTAVAP